MEYELIEEATEERCALVIRRDGGLDEPVGEALSTRQTPCSPIERSRPPLAASPQMGED